MITLQRRENEKSHVFLNASAHNLPIAIAITRDFVKQ